MGRTTSTPSNLDKVSKYCRDVLSGKIPACLYVRQAVQRHLEDLENGQERGLYFDEKEAERGIKIYSYFKHSKGEWAGMPFELEPWQMFIDACVFGWKRKDGTRRFNVVYQEVARKNGKTTTLAGVGLRGIIKDGEQGAEVYSAATKRDQAKLMWDEAKRMAESSPVLSKRLTVYGGRSPTSSGSIVHTETASKFQPLGADADTTDGLNVHFGLVDEIHAHKTPAMWQILDSATGSRRQPLMWTITTAGFNKNGIGYELRGYTIKVLSGAVQDDAHFGIIYTLDEGDQWDDPDVWIKANPNLGVSVQPGYLHRKITKAREMPSERNNFLCKHLNIWTNAETLWMNMEHWNDCNAPVKLNELEKAPCYAGLDLASTADIAALALVWRIKEHYYIYCKYYLPKDRVSERTEKDQVPYQQWADEGLFTLTDGKRINYNAIKNDIFELAERFNLKKIAYDRWNSSQLVSDLEDEGIEMEGFGQGFASMNAPMKELEGLILDKKLSHGGDPILTWMASNLAAKEDEAGNIKPAKNKSLEKIDGIVAGLMGLGTLIDDDPDDQGDIDGFLNNPVMVTH